MSQQTTYQAVSWDGRTEIFVAYAYSDAYQQATDWAGDAGLQEFYES